MDIVSDIQRHMTSAPVLFDRWYLAFAVVGIILGGIVGAFLIGRCILWCCLKKPSYHQFPHRPTSSAVHLLVLFIKAVLIIAGFVIGFWVLGMNVLSLAVSLGILVWALTYTLSKPVSAVATSGVIFLQNLFEEGSYLRLPMWKEEGNVITITEMFTYLQRTTAEEGTVDVMIPNDAIWSQPIERVYDKDVHVSTLDHRNKPRTMVQQVIAPAQPRHGIKSV